MLISTSVSSSQRPKIFCVKKTETISQFKNSEFAFFIHPVVLQSAPEKRALLKSLIVGSAIRNLSVTRPFKS